MAKPTEVVMRARVMRTIKNLTFVEKVRVLAGVLKAIGLPNFSLQLTEELDQLDG